ncbi:hypothetical protein ACFVWN_01180 [Nocardiopsis flavescens]|uniref:hypothetical protein n=1 Tax=Nocardiopsis flavescens TaxID=758803 RepID=UPI003667E47C
MTRRATIAVDFDGVIHTYDRGWADGTIYGGLIPGAGAALELLMDTYSVFVHTSRSPAQVVAWLNRRWSTDRDYTVTADDRCPVCTGHGRTFSPPAGKHGLEEDCSSCERAGRVRFWTRPGVLLVTDRKLPALVYIDDRAIRFTSWDQALNDFDTVEGRAR